MQKLKLYIAAHAMLIWLIVIIMLMTASISFGAYTYMKYAKRVVSTVNDNGIPFSSNLLSQISSDSDDSSFTNALFTFSKNQNSGDSRVITVCNYPQNDINSVNQGDIDYTFNIKVKKPDGTDMTDSDFETLGIDIFLKLNNGEPVKFNGSDITLTPPSALSAGSPATDVYTITIKLKEDIKYDDFDFTKFYLAVTAKPDNTSSEYTSGYMLARNLMYTKNKDSQGWSGIFVDKFNDDSPPKKYDGFNYEIKGNGAGTVTLTWNKDYVDIDPNFKDSLEEGQLTVSDTAGDNELKFKVGGSYLKSGYRVQFYRVVPCPETEQLDENGIVVPEENGTGYVVLNYEPDSENKGSDDDNKS